MNKDGTTKVNLTLSNSLLAKLDEFVKLHYVKRSNVMTLALAQYLSTQDLIESLRKMVNIMDRVSKCGSLSDDDREKLNEYARLVELMSGTFK